MGFFFALLAFRYRRMIGLFIILSLLLGPLFVMIGFTLATR
jgi:hypothetical protein